MKKPGTSRTFSLVDRNKYQQLVSGGADRLETDQVGHLIASILGGPGEGINLTAIDGALIQAAY